MEDKAKSTESLVRPRNDPESHPPDPRSTIHWHKPNVNPNWVQPPSKSEASTGLYDTFTTGDYTSVIHDWKTNQDARIEPFLERWPPSRTNTRECACLIISRSSSPALTVEVMDEFAVRYGVLGGEWLFVAKSRDVDRVWGKVVHLVAYERGSGFATVKTRKAILSDSSSTSLPPVTQISMEGNSGGAIPDPQQWHWITVSVVNYMNKRDVDELRRGLRLRAGVHWKIGFKPDVYTWLGIYKGNKFGLKPTRDKS